MNDVKEKEPEDSPGIGTLITVGVIVMTIVVGLGIYQYVSGPFRIADELNEKLDSYGNVSDDYRQGWLDCVATYLKITTGPTNMTSDNIN